MVQKGVSKHAVSKHAVLICFYLSDKTLTERKVLLIRELTVRFEKIIANANKISLGLKLRMSEGDTAHHTAKTTIHNNGENNGINISEKFRFLSKPSSREDLKKCLE